MKLNLWVGGGKLIAFSKNFIQQSILILVWNTNLCSLFSKQPSKGKEKWSWQKAKNKYKIFFRKSHSEIHHIQDLSNQIFGVSRKPTKLCRSYLPVIKDIFSQEYLLFAGKEPAKETLHAFKLIKIHPRMVPDSCSFWFN